MRVLLSTELINRDPEIMGGTPTFAGTRVPVKTFFDYLEGGYTLDEFLRNFPSVRRDQSTDLLEMYKEMLLAEVR